MENNENNVQNQESRKKETKGLSAPLVIIILLTVLIIGIGGGYLLSKNDTLFNKNGTQSNNANNTENNITKQNKTSKKIDESKDWVYDAEYLKSKEEKKVSSEYTNDIDITTAQIKAPYINVNSDEVKKVNQEIEKLAIEQYNLFGKKDGEYTYYTTSMDYLYSSSGDNLSILIMYDTAICGTGAGIETLKSYNIKINNQNEKDENYIAGYNKDVIKSKIDEFSKKENSEGDKLTMIDGEYFIYNNQLYVICTGGYSSGGIRDSKQYLLFDVNNMKEIPFSQIKDVLKNKKTAESEVEQSNNTIENENNSVSSSKQNVKDVKFEIVPVDNSGKIYMTATGYDSKNNKIWQYKTQEGDDVQYVTFEGMGVKNNKVYLFEQGYVVCLDQQTGNVLWKYNINNNAKYSDAGCLKGAYVIANDGTVYIAVSNSQYDLYIINNNGNIIKSYSKGELFVNVKLRFV